MSNCKKKSLPSRASTAIPRSTKNSILVHTQTGCRHQVPRDRRGKLLLDPPYDPISQLFAENK
jgi:hypothetical protein